MPPKKGGPGGRGAEHELRYGIVRTVSASMARGLTTKDLGAPDLALARRQQEAYVRTLRALGMEVTVLEALDALPDSHFVEDVAVLVRGTAILTRPAADERRGEVALIRPVLETRMPVRELGGRETDRLDGGDVLVSGGRVWIGIGRRTNRRGAELLRQRLREVDPSLGVTLVPFSGCLHLKSGITALAPGRFIADPALRLARPWTGGSVHWLPPAEGTAADVLVANGAILVDAASPSARRLAEEAGGRAIPLDLSEFRKMDGGLTCLSLLY